MKIVVLIIVAGFIIQHMFPIIQVIGDSMYPTYLDGEFLVGTKFYRKSALKEGEVILYESPTEDGKIVIKRIHSIIQDHRGVFHYYCLGDNAEQSYDSRYYGYVPSKNVVCKVIDQRAKIEKGDTLV